jgi:hypothetical protein
MESYKYQGTIYAQQFPRDDKINDFCPTLYKDRTTIHSGIREVLKNGLHKALVRMDPRESS